MATTAATTTWTADTVHSTANFAVRHMVVATFRGAFTDVTGTLDLAGERPRLAGEVDVASIQVKDENLYGHLQSPEFFDAGATPKITFVSDSVVRDGDDVTSRATSRSRARRSASPPRALARDRGRHHRQPAHRHRRRDDGRPHGVRAQLERPASQGRRRARERRDALRPPRVRSGRGLSAMRILAISGSLRRDSHNTRLLRAAAGLLPPGAELERARSRRPARHPPLRRGPARGRRARRRHGAARARRRRGRRPRLHPRVQPLASRRAEERDRLALAAARREPVPRQGRRRRRREHRHVRRRLGAGGGPQGPGRRRRPRRRTPSCRSSTRTSSSPRTGRSSTRACATRWPQLAALVDATAPELPAAA